MFMRKAFMFMLVFLTAVFFLSAGKAQANPIPAVQCAAGGCTVGYESSEDICNFEAKTEAEVANDPSHNYPYGLFEFSLGNCQEELQPQLAGNVRTKGTLSTSITLYFFDSQHNQINMEGYTYRKYGPTPDNPTPHWYDFMYDGTTGAVISGYAITLYFVDGQRGDDDISDNGQILDQGGPGQTEIPTMTEWGMIVFMVFAGLGSVYYMRRQRRAEQR
jgi:hypothetical protein